MLRKSNRTTYVLLLGAMAALAACARSDSVADKTASSSGTSNTAIKPSGGVGASATTTTPLTDAGVFAMLAAANQEAISAGKLAESSVTSAAVKSFAHDMVIAHTAVLSEGNTLATKLKMTPDAALPGSVGAIQPPSGQGARAEPKVQAHLDRIRTIQGKLA